MNEQKKTARVAGLLYLAFIVLGMFSVMYVDEALAVTGDAAATIENSRANLPLYRVGLAAFIAGYVCFVFIAIALRKLFKSVNNGMTIIMITFVLAGTAIVVAGKLAQLYAVVSSSDALMAFYSNCDTAATIFWGLWLLPLGLLIMKSNLIPKAIGGSLLAAGASNLIHFALTVISPVVLTAAEPALYAIGMIGEFAFVAWLLIKGVKTASGSGEMSQ